MANLANILPQVINDADGNPVPGALVTLYESGTTTLKQPYSDSALSVALSNPLVADANGKLPGFYLAAGAVKAVITTSTGATLDTVDPAFVTTDSVSAASQITFSPTVEIPADNVQDAIVLAAASAASGYATYGVGITGNATLLANLDDTGIGGGEYRFDATTTGTFPAGVVASTTGIVKFVRQTSSTAKMFLYPVGSDREYVRRLTSSAYQSWRENITSNQTLTRGDLVYMGASSPSRLAVGSAGRVLRSDGTDPGWGSAWTLSATSATTSGSTVNFSSIPSWVRKIIVHFNAVSCTASANVGLRIGTSGSADTTGYSNNSYRIRDGASPLQATPAPTTYLFVVNHAAGSDTLSADVFLNLTDTSTNRWSMSVGPASRTGSDLFLGYGSKSLSGALDIVQVYTDGTFDAGSVSISYS
jgi:hypothetical protein